MGKSHRTRFFDRLHRHLKFLTVAVVVAIVPLYQSIKHNHTIMSLSKLSQLRATMESLESYELDEKFTEEPVDQVLDAETVERYTSARDEYIHRRMLQVFYDHIGTFDEGHEFDLPQLATPQEQAALQERRKTVQQELLATAAQVFHSNQTLQQKYTAFCARREELAKMISDIEQNHSMSSQDDDMDEDDDVDQEAFTYEGQHLADTTQRKAQLEMELARIRHEKQVALQSLDETKKQVDELQKNRGAVVRAVSPETLEELESQTAGMRQKVEELKEMSEWYGGLCEVMEEIGGIKLLGVEQDTDNAAEQGVICKVHLLGTHKVHVHMSSRGNAFHVTNAKFVSSTLVRSAEDPETKSFVQMNIPALDDLVRLAKNMGSVDDLRFLLREAMARIRTITARVEELAILRTRFLTKIESFNIKTTVLVEKTKRLSVVSMKALQQFFVSRPTVP